MDFIYAILASLLVSIISLVGICTLIFKKELLERILISLVGLSAGGLIGGAFFHMLPEAIKNLNLFKVFVITLFGFLLFFVIEKYLFWRHCHRGQCDVHIFRYLNLLGDAVHNFIDGVIIGTGFRIGPYIGIPATVSIIMHEIPQEIGDFGVLVYGGFGKFKALFYNFLSALTSVLGTILGFYLSSHIQAFSFFLLPFAGGGFLYIAICDLIPEIYKQKDTKRTNTAMLFFVLGILVMFLLRFFFHICP